MKVGQYFYRICGRGYRIYRYVYVENGATAADPVADEPVYFDPEKARRRVYELNGWNYKPEKTCKRN